MYDVAEEQKKGWSVTRHECVLFNRLMVTDTLLEKGLQLAQT